MRELLSIGRFARLSGLTVRAIRHYGELGLLVPRHVDEQTGYRWYDRDQLAAAEAIRRLRSLELPLDDVRELVARPEPGHVRVRLAAHRDRLGRRVAEAQRILAELDRLIDGEEELVPGPDKETIEFKLTIEEVEPRRGLGLRLHVHVDEVSRAIPQAIDEVAAHLRTYGLEAAGPPFCVCPFGDEEEGEIVVGWPVAEQHEGEGRVEAVELPSGRALVLRHVGPYDALPRSYRLMHEVMTEGGLAGAGDPVELYETDPAVVADPNELVTVIVWPVGPEGDLPAPRDTFTRRVEAPVR